MQRIKGEEIMKKRILALVLAILLFVSAVPVQAFAATGSSITDAKTITLGTTYSRSWTPSTDTNNYYVKFTIPADGYITMTSTRPTDDSGNTGHVLFTVHDSKGEQVWGSSSYYCDADATSLKLRTGLKKGTYYLNLTPAFYVIRGSIGVKFSVNFKAVANYEAEGNSSKDTAKTMKPYQTYYGFSGGSSYDRDYWKFYVSNDCKVKIYLPNYKTQSDTAVQSSYFYFIDGEGKTDYYFDKEGTYDSQGRFYVEVDAKQGYNYVEIEASKTQVVYGIRVEYAHTCKWNKGTVTRKPTSSKNGILTRTCTICGAEKTSVIPKNKVAKIVTQPKNVNVLEGKTAKTTVRATGAGLRYQWYYRNVGAAKFSKAKQTTATYTAKMSDACDGRQIYCVVTDQYGTKVKTKVVTLSMKETVEIVVQPKGVTVASGKVAKATVRATGDGLRYQWYHRAPGVAKFGLAAGMNGASYSLTMNAARSGRQVYCVIKDQYGNSVKTNVVTLRMK